MEQTLLAGCSFLDIGTQPPFAPYDKIRYDKYRIKGDPGSGNESIAARVRYEVDVVGGIEHVVVLWSGVNRVDIAIAMTEHETFEFQEYKYITHLPDPKNYMLWYHSCGIVGHWLTSDACPKYLKTLFRERYLHHTTRSASDETLKIIADTQKFLDSRGITYDMSFIYDVSRNYDDVVDYYSNRQRRSFDDVGRDRWPNLLALEHTLGELDTSSVYYTDVDWSVFKAEIPVYEYCLERNLLQADHFHPTKEGLKQWFQTQLDMWLTS